MSIEVYRDAPKSPKDWPVGDYFGKYAVVRLHLRWHVIAYYDHAKEWRFIALPSFWRRVNALRIAQALWLERVGTYRDATEAFDERMATSDIARHAKHLAWIVDQPEPKEGSELDRSRRMMLREVCDRVRNAIALAEGANAMNARPSNERGEAP